MTKRRVHLTFTGKLTEEPILWQLSQTFDLVFNIRQADFTEGIGWIMAELEEISSRLRMGSGGWRIAGSMWRRSSRTSFREVLHLCLTAESGFDYISAVGLFIQSG
ncbi:MAG: NIL domain-containing protein [Candidatus Methylomirabilis sp.]|nr:NIL domain-containing protein [Candidatus Methylomirabilis sp.]